MLIPLTLLFLVLALGLLTAGRGRTSRRVLAILTGLLWLLGAGSAFFVGWAWLERDYSENWVLLGVLFFSLPAAVAASALAAVTIAAARRRKIDNFRKIELSLYLLLLFLIVQATFGLWLWR